MNLSTGILAILLLGAAGIAGAQQTADHADYGRGDQLQRRNDGGYDNRDGGGRADRTSGAGPAAQSAPEISAGSVIVALTLLGGGLIVLRGRREPRKGRA